MAETATQPIPSETLIQSSQNAAIDTPVQDKPLDWQSKAFFSQESEIDDAIEVYNGSRGQQGKLSDLFRQFNVKPDEVQDFVDAQVGLLPEGLGFAGTVRDYAKAIPNAVYGFKRSATELVESGIKGIAGVFGGEPEFTEDPEVGPFGPQRTMVGNFIKSGTQFGLGWISGGSIIKAGAAATTGVRVVSNIARGGIADFISFDGQEERLSNLVQQFPLLENPVTEFLAADPDDGEAFGRLKNTLEGFGLGVGIDVLGVGIDGFVSLLKIHRAARSASKKGGAKAADDVIASSQKEVAKAVDQIKKADVGEDAVRKKAFELWDGAGRPEGQDKKFWNQAKGELSKTETKKSTKATKTQTTKTVDIRPVKGVRLSDKAKSSLAKRAKQVRSGEIAVSDIAEGADFNFSKMASPKEAKDLINDVSETIALTIDDLKGGKQSFEEISSAAEVLGTTPEQLLGDIAKDAELSAQRASRLVAGKTVMQGLAKHISDRASVMNAQGLDDAAIRLELGRVLDLFATVHSQTKAIQTGSARATAAGRIMTKDSLNALDHIQLENLSNGLILSGGDLRAVSKLATRGWADKLFSAHNHYWINAILSHPKTHMVNMVGTLTKLLGIPTEQIIGGTTDLLKGDSRAIKEGLRQYVEIIGTFKDSFRMAAKSAQLNQNILTGSHSLVDAPVLSTQGFGKTKKAVAETVGLPVRALMTEDEFFKQVAYRSHVRARLWREAIDQGLDGDDLAQFVTEGFEKSFDVSGKGLNQAALDHAADATFTRQLEYGVGKAIQDFRSTHPGLSLIFPFIRTGVNLFRDTVARLPAGLGLLQKQLRDDLRSADFGVRAKARGKIITGSALSATAVSLAYEGRITGGGPKDRNRRRELMAQGWQPYSVVINNDDGSKSYLKYERLEPVSNLFRLAADYSEIKGQVEDGEADSLAFSMTAAILKGVSSKTWLSGVEQIMDIFDGREAPLKRFVETRISSYIPNGAKILNDDPVMREARDLLDRTRQKVRGFSDTLPPFRDMFGEAITPPAGTGLKSINPFVLSTQLPDDVKLELNELRHGFGHPSKLISGVDLTEFINDEGREAYDRLLELQGKVEIGGKTLYETLQQVIRSNDYQSLPQFANQPFDSDRLRQVSRIIASYRIAAERRMFQEFPDVESAFIQAKIDEISIRSGQTQP